MSTGLISSPASWLNGTVAPASWFQSVQDNINQLLKNPATYQTVNATVTVGAAAGSTGFAGTSGATYDCAGSIQVRPGGTGIASGILATVLFQNSTLFSSLTFINGPSVILTPANAAAAAISGTSQVWPTSTLSGAGGTWTGWQLNTSAALVSGTTYTWNYVVIIA